MWPHMGEQNNCLISVDQRHADTLGEGVCVCGEDNTVTLGGDTDDKRGAASPLLHILLYLATTLTKDVSPSRKTMKSQAEKLTKKL